LNTHEIDFNGLKIHHTSKPNLKNSYISVSKDLVITLKTPIASKSFIYDLLSKKELWIKKQLFKLKQNPPVIVSIEDEVLLFGEIYSIDSLEASQLRSSLARLRCSNKNKVLKCYDDFYKSYAKEYLTKRAIHLSKNMNLLYSELKFRKMKTRWGSCSSKKVITLNTKLIKLNKKLIDYIIVHELSHLIHMNHSKKFHSLVSLYMPDAKHLDKELKTVNLAD